PSAFPLLTSQAPPAASGFPLSPLPGNSGIPTSGQRGLRLPAPLHVLFPAGSVPLPEARHGYVPAPPCSLSVPFWYLPVPSCSPQVPYGFLPVFLSDGRLLPSGGSAPW